MLPAERLIRSPDPRLPALPLRPRGPTLPRVKIELNGEPREVREGTTLEGLLGELGLTEPMVATEVNMAIVVRAERGKTVLREGDKVEVVSFVGGG